MTFASQTIALIAMAVGLVGMAWAVFWPRKVQSDTQLLSTHWDLVYIDDNGLLQFTVVRVLKINPLTRRMTAWCTASNAERVFKLNKVVKATDVHSGGRIHIATLVDMPQARRGRPANAVDPVDSRPTQASTWWRTSSLMH